MHAFLVWVETTALSVWVRESPTVFAFPVILSLHTVGMGLVAGLNAFIDLRVLGFAPRVPVVETNRLFPVIWFGFWLNALSGIVLLIAYPTKALTNPVFYTKLILVALGLVSQTLIRRRVLQHPAPAGEPMPGRWLALASLVFWAGAIATGRLLAYTYTTLTSI